VRPHPLSCYSSLPNISHGHPSRPASDGVCLPFSMSSRRSLINFYGAFYREGCITLALEMMDGGALSNVVAQVRTQPTMQPAPPQPCKTRSALDAGVAGILISHADRSVSLTIGPGGQSGLRVC
jgi:hypothetical protein